jgi:hypothetical protein
VLKTEIMKDLIKELSNKLSKYGKIENISFPDDRLHVKITDGFSGSLMDTCGLMKDIDEITQDGYPIVKRAVTRQGMFDYIVSKKGETKQ